MRHYRLLYHLSASVLALLAAGGLAITGAIPASAAPQPVASAAAQAALTTHLLTKIVLLDTSIDGPALSSIYVPNQTSESVLAWTGTDKLHHLNVETSGDGLHFSGKRILEETSPYRPDVALAAPAGAVAVAWTGTDANHSLNVLYDIYGHQRKLTLWNESSISAPALLIGPGFYLAWTGTDANHSLNLMPIEVTDAGLTPGKKVILSHFSSNAGPHLARVGATTFALSWTSQGSQLFVATGTDAPTLSVSSLSEWSAFAPQTESLGRVQGSGKQWIGWTGTDAAHQLNLQWNFTDPATKTILNEMALGGPALAFHAQEQLAWTGTDSLHHLNIATFAAS
jgi:hypothetical protein